MTGIVQTLIGGFGAAAAAVTDAYFYLTTLLLPGNGTNGAQNNTFLDSSTNNFTITRNGNTTQGTFSPFSQTGWSNYFDGTDDYLSVADNAVLRPGAGAFTLEAWIYRGASGAAHTIYAKGGASTGIVFQVTSGNVLRFTHTTTNIDSTGTVSADTWTHVAVVREGTGTNQTKLYINGTQDGQGTVSTDFTQTEEVRIGTNRGATEDFNGYISNLRFTKGAALYTGNFTPSTSPLTTTSQGASATDVELLTCQSNRFVDNSSNGFSITVNNNASVQAFSPFAPTAEYSAATVGGSGYFDGTGDSLSVADNSAFDLSGSTSWCIETWAYYNTLSGEQNIVEKFTTPSGPGWTLYKLAPNNINGTLEIYGGTSSFNSAHTPVAGQWIHIVCCRDDPSGRTSWFINGSRTATTTSFSIASNASTPLLVGARVGGSNNHNGYLCGTRVIKGSSEYDPSQTTITVPNSPPTNITNTSLLLNYTNAGITDATAKNDLETVGNAQISTAQSKFGGSSMYFDGTGDWLIAPSSQNFNMGTGNWTVECWVYPSSTATRGLFQITTGHLNSVATGIGVGVSAATGNPWRVYHGTTATDTSTNVTTGSWQHIAFVRNGSAINLYLNGTSIYSATDSSDLSSYTFLTVGAWFSSSFPWLGYIDDFRITKGYARYTANFTAPTTAFPLQ
jgi:hypothetical protein